MTLGLLPRLMRGDAAVRDWASQFAARLEFLFAYPPQVGIPALSQFTASAASGGYLTIPSIGGNIVLAWGADSLASPNVTKAITFAKAFPTACWAVVPAGADTHAISYSASSIATTGFTVNASSSTGTRAFNYVAVGN